METWFATIRTQTCPAVVKERGGGVASERGVKADGGSGPLTLGEALDNRGHVADRVVAGHRSHPPRLAKAGDAKKAPGPSCVVPYHVCACAHVHLFKMYVGTVGPFPRSRGI